MKILKIELQNLNSLKSDTPICIDFQSERFKDVGLFAITGSTGAGKTTILDAITIALYHSVPRFNDSKGTLRDVVSHGAGEAQSIVTFENENQVYEASWYMRLTSKSGKALKNPQEEVSLKNLSTGVILSSQKRAVMEDVIAVTQLDYNQFLRSVMLAQGEFASFLTAKGKEKGRLLEQITGEQIYKKIGQGILDRRSLEERKLNDIKSKINADDLLNEEEQLQIIEKSAALDSEILEIEKQLLAVQEIAAWFVKYKELHQEQEDILKRELDLKSELQSHAPDFGRLENHIHAAPFDQLIQQLVRVEQQLLERTQLAIENKKEQKVLLPELEKLNSDYKKHQQTLTTAQTQFEDWQPKFDKITTLDHKMVSVNKELETITTEGSKIKTELQRATTEFTETKEKLDQVQHKIKNKTESLSKKNFLLEVDQQITDWNTDFTNLASYYKLLETDTKSLKHKEKEAQLIAGELAENASYLKTDVEKVDSIQSEITYIDQQLAKTPLEDLLNQQKKLNIQVSNWKDLKVWSDTYLSYAQENKQNDTLKNSYTADLADLKTQSEALQEQLTSQELQVRDAQRILDLEKSLSKYEDDRKHLVDGEPCHLCGSTTHPYAVHLDHQGVSAATLQVKQRQEILQTLQHKKSALENKQVHLNTSLENINQRMIEVKKQQEIVQIKAASLALHANLADRELINSELLKSTESLKLIEKNIRDVQQLQAQKNALSTSITDDEKRIISLKAKEATLQEKQKNNTSDISDKERSINQLNHHINELIKSLKEKLAAFNYELPSENQMHHFIKTLENEIKLFNQTQKKLDELTSEKEILSLRIKNTEEQKNTLNEKREELRMRYKENLASLQKLKDERYKLLPEQFTVESKRTALKDLLKTYTDQAQKTQKKLQDLLDRERELNTLALAHTKEIDRLKVELKSLNNNLEEQLEKSDFNSRESVEQAILKPDDFENISKKKKLLKDQELGIRTLKEKNKEALSSIQQSKNFETTQEENDQRSKNLIKEKDRLLATKGEIKEVLRKDQEIRDRNSEIHLKIDAQEKVYRTWKELFKIIGNSKDAFNDYVQRLTLKHLLELANVHLFQLNKRYSLKMDEDYKLKEDLNFNLIDHYQTDQARLVDTSSGGEKFIISLALALGLSDLASKNVRIDSLFIDEGFGTLDKNTLETVISTLETLQSQGKMIGIISHVENLKERIPTQIQITKKSNGISRVTLT